MTEEMKLTYIKNILNLTDSNDDSLIQIYLDMSKETILNYKYEYSSVLPIEMAPEDELTQIYAVIAGFNNRGNENMTGATENGITSQFKYTDMLSYIKNNVVPKAKVCL